MRKELKSEGGFPFGLWFERVQNHGGDNMEVELEVSVYLLSTAKKQSNERLVLTWLLCFLVYSIQDHSPWNGATFRVGFLFLS